MVWLVWYGMVPTIPHHTVYNYNTEQEYERWPTIVDKYTLYNSRSRDSPFSYVALPSPISYTETFMRYMGYLWIGKSERGNLGME